MNTTRREIIGAGLGMGLLGTQSLVAQQSQSAPTARTEPTVPVRKGKITKLFKSPEGYPNALAAAPEGWWIAEQKSDHACLVDHDGKLLKTVKTESKNTSGIAFGEGDIWMCANAAPNGIYQTDIDSKTVRHRQIPLGGGGCHGAEYFDGKLWLAALRLRGILRVDPKTWEPEFLIPYSVPRAHGLTFENGSVWLVTGSDAGAGLIKYDSETGKVLETVQFDELYPDPHGLAFHEGSLYTCDAGIHPGWPENKSPASGYICRIDIS
jgi:sugar lactone lactonase YvrE